MTMWTMWTAQPLALVLGCLCFMVASAGKKNFTVYRITPRNYTGITNLDTGDAAGDAFFGLYEKTAPVVCKSHITGGAQLLCTNDPLLQIPGFNVYIQVIVEADDRFGFYAECNPSPTPPHDFECKHFHRENHCWNKDPEHPEWAKEFAGVCKPDVCQCDAIDSKSVGLEYPNFGAHSPPGTPSQCAANYYVLGYFGNANKSTIIKSIEPASLSECCSACTAENSVNTTKCDSYTYTKLSKKCVLHGATSFGDFRPDPFAASGFFSGLGLSAYLQRAAGKLSEIMNGTWYSTQEPGRCQPGQVIGKDCWWRVVKQTAQVNASCVNDFMISKVKAQRKGECFDQCPHADDENSDCVIACLFETLVGNATASPPVPATPRQVIIDAFEAAFAPGGCAPVPDCPKPCLPPCWGVPKGDPCNSSITSYF